jgi:hypothetical protein
MPMTDYQFPSQDILVRYLAMLREVLVDARMRAYDRDPQTAKLLDAVENVPDLLARWPDMQEEIVIGELQSYEGRFLKGAPKYSSILLESPRPDWQLKWK